MQEPRITRRFVATPAAQLHCREVGRGDPVVLLQTLPVGTAQLVPLMRALAPRCRCVALDLAGTWPSDPRPGPWTVEDYATNLLDALDSLGLGRVRLLAGHLTALVAVEMALRQPRRFSHLALDGLYAWTAEESEPYRKAASAGVPPPWAAAGGPVKVRWETFTGMLRRFDPDFDVTPANAAFVAELGFAFLSLGTAPASPSPTFGYDLLTRLPRVESPVLLFRSATDSLGRFVPRALQLLPDAREHAFEGVNPLQHVARPGRIHEYADVLAEFFGLASAP